MSSQEGIWGNLYNVTNGVRNFIVNTVSPRLATESSDLPPTQMQVPLSPIPLPLNLSTSEQPKHRVSSVGKAAERKAGGRDGRGRASANNNGKDSAVTTASLRKDINLSKRKKQPIASQKAGEMEEEEKEDEDEDGKEEVDEGEESDDDVDNDEEEGDDEDDEKEEEEEDEDDDDDDDEEEDEDDDDDDDGFRIKSGMHSSARISNQKSQKRKKTSSSSSRSQMTSRQKKMEEAKKKNAIKERLAAKSRKNQASKRRRSLSRNRSSSSSSQKGGSAKKKGTKLESEKEYEDKETEEEYNEEEEDDDDENDENYQGPDNNDYDVNIEDGDGDETHDDDSDEEEENDDGDKKVDIHKIDNFGRPVEVKEYEDDEEAEPGVQLKDHEFKCFDCKGFFPDKYRRTEKLATNRYVYLCECCDRKKEAVCMACKEISKPIDLYYKNAAKDVDNKDPCHKFLCKPCGLKKGLVLKFDSSSVSVYQYTKKAMALKARKEKGSKATKSSAAAASDDDDEKASDDIKDDEDDEEKEDDEYEKKKSKWKIDATKIHPRWHKLGLIKAKQWAFYHPPSSTSSLPSVPGRSYFRVKRDNREESRDMKAIGGIWDPRLRHYWVPLGSVAERRLLEAHFPYWRKPVMEHSHHQYPVIPPLHLSSSPAIAPSYAHAPAPAPSHQFIHRPVQQQPVQQRLWGSHHSVQQRIWGSHHSVLDQDCQYCGKVVQVGIVPPAKRTHISCASCKVLEPTVGKHYVSIGFDGNDPSTKMGVNLLKIKTPELLYDGLYGPIPFKSTDTEVEKRLLSLIFAHKNALHAAGGPNTCLVPFGHIEELEFNLICHKHSIDRSLFQIREMLVAKRSKRDQDDYYSWFHDYLARHATLDKLKARYYEAVKTCRKARKMMEDEGKTIHEVLKMNIPQLALPIRVTFNFENEELQQQQLPELKSAAVLAFPFEPFSDVRDRWFATTHLGDQLKKLLTKSNASSSSSSSSTVPVIPPALFSKTMRRHLRAEGKNLHFSWVSHGKFETEVKDDEEYVCKHRLQQEITYIVKISLSRVRNIEDDDDEDDVEEEKEEVEVETKTSSSARDGRKRQRVG